MLKIKINWSTFWFLIFIVSTYITYAVNSTHFDVTRAADYEYYRDYLYYFFGEIETTNKEQGSLYKDMIQSSLKENYPSYYFNKLEKQSRSKKKKLSGLPIDVQNALRELERTGKK